MLYCELEKDLVLVDLHGRTGVLVGLHVLALFATLLLCLCPRALVLLALHLSERGS